MYIPWTKNKKQFSRSLGDAWDTITQKNIGETKRQKTFRSLGDARGTRLKKWRVLAGTSHLPKPMFFFLVLSIFFVFKMAGP